MCAIVKQVQLILGTIELEFWGGVELVSFFAPSTNLCVYFGRNHKSCLECQVTEKYAIINIHSNYPQTRFSGLHRFRLGYCIYSNWREA